jgi:hypothetical protein
MTVASAKHESHHSDGTTTTWYNPVYFLFLPITVPIDVLGYPIEQDMGKKLGQIN